MAMENGRLLCSARPDRNCQPSNRKAAERAMTIKAATPANQDMTLNATSCPDAYAVTIAMMRPRAGVNIEELNTPTAPVRHCRLSSRMAKPS